MNVLRKHYISIFPTNSERCFYICSFLTERKDADVASFSRALLNEVVAYNANLMQTKKIASKMPFST